jgi:hypothetical protein
MKDKITHHPLGGLGVGRNMMVYEYNGEILIVDTRKDVSTAIYGSITSSRLAICSIARQCGSLSPRPRGPLPIRHVLDETTPIYATPSPRFEGKLPLGHPIAPNCIVHRPNCPDGPFQVSSSTSVIPSLMGLVYITTPVA